MNKLNTQKRVYDIYSFLHEDIKVNYELLIKNIKILK